MASDQISESEIRAADGEVQGRKEENVVDDETGGNTQVDVEDEKL
jgi:hypothetical protein